MPRIKVLGAMLLALAGCQGLGTPANNSAPSATPQVSALPQPSPSPALVPTPVPTPTATPGFSGPSPTAPPQDVVSSHVIPSPEVIQLSPLAQELAQGTTPMAFKLFEVARKQRLMNNVIFSPLGVLEQLMPVYETRPELRERLAGFMGLRSTPDPVMLQAALQEVIETAAGKRLPAFTRYRTQQAHGSLRVVNTFLDQQGAQGSRPSQTESVSIQALSAELKLDWLQKKPIVNLHVNVRSSPDGKLSEHRVGSYDALGYRQSDFTALDGTVRKDLSYIGLSSYSRKSYITSVFDLPLKGDERNPDYSLKVMYLLKRPTLEETQTDYFKYYNYQFYERAIREGRELQLPNQGLRTEEAHLSLPKTLNESFVNLSELVGQAMGVSLSAYRDQLWHHGRVNVDRQSPVEKHEYYKTDELANWYVSHEYMEKTYQLHLVDNRSKALIHFALITDPTQGASQVGF